MKDVLISVLLFFSACHSLSVTTFFEISSGEGNFNGALEAFDEFGFSMAILSDFNQGSTADLAVGANLDDDGGTDRGAVYVLSLNSDATVNSFQKISNTEGNFTANLIDNDQFGSSVASLGDFNGDGTTDLVVGAPLDDDGGMDRGAVYVLFLNSDATVNSFQKISDTQGNFNGTLDNSDGFGLSVASLGDFNRDGTTDIVVGAHFDDDGGPEKGAIYILLLNSDATVNSFQKISDTQGNFNGTLDSLDEFGLSVASLGDFNRDGTTDIAVGAIRDDDGGGDRGALYILFLNPDATVNSYQKISDTQGNFERNLDDGDLFGFSVSSLGDFNGDGTTDLVVAARFDDDGGVNRGALYVLFLNPDATVNSFQKISSNQGGLTNSQNVLNDEDRFGSSVAFLASGSLILAGAGLVDGGGLINSGAVFLLQVDICGNGVVTNQEACDDGNILSNDGCSANCEIERGFQCLSGMTPSICQTICGDGIIVPILETCDDLNQNGGDGCSEVCQTEAGYNCNICESICGDGIIAGDEECDDNNILSGDGCSSLCSAEPPSSSLSTGAIIGIVAGSVFFLCVLILVLFSVGFCILSKIKKEKVVFDFDLLGDTIPILTDIEIGKAIGSGAFGDVYQAKWNNIDVALKSTRAEDLTEFQNEIQLMLEMRHPNILQFFGLYFRASDKPMIVTEFMNRGDLLHLLQTQADITAKQLAEFCHQISLGMEYLHSRNILHRDLACRNILVSGKVDEDNSNLTLKVADFGLSRQTEDYYQVQSKKIPIRWTAPEVIEFRKASKASDVWSYGVVVWEIFSRGAIPFAGLLHQQVIELIKKKKRLQPPPNMPPEISEIMKKCWYQDPKNRVSFPEISEKLKMALTMELEQTPSVMFKAMTPTPSEHHKTIYKGLSTHSFTSSEDPIDEYGTELHQLKNEILDLKEENARLREENSQIPKLKEEIDRLSKK